MKRAAALLPVVLFACLDDAGTPLASFQRRIGSLDVEQIVAVGDGLAAGASDGALFRSGQERSVPALFNQHVTGGLDFAQPLIADPGIAIDGEEGGRLALVSAFPPVIERLPRGGPLDSALDRPYSNLGVPGALLSEALVAESAASSISGNPFYDIVLRDRGTFAEQVEALDATLILLWIGTNDVLQYARVGGDGELAPGLPTPVSTFASVYENLLDRLMAVTDQVVLFNVPDVTEFPFLTTVPPVVIDPVTGEPVTVTVIEVVIDPQTGDTLTARREEPVPLVGQDGPLAPGDLVSLGAGPLLAEGVGIPASQGGSGDRLPDHLVLDLGEQALARDAIAGYNEAIAEIAVARSLAVVDVHAVVEALAEDGLVSDGVLLTAEFLTGQAFSLDGLRFSAKGYGLIANRLIDAVNLRYEASLPHLRTADLPGVPLTGR
ncbi:MAG: hypothetical protein H0W36_06110 [Gemmatimonadetes bacterium]|nr:hypothetical protein [Gemmatimonadota bacterium]